MLNRDSMAPSFRTDLSQITAWLSSHAETMPTQVMESDLQMVIWVLNRLTKDVDFYLEQQQEKTA